MLSVCYGHQLMAAAFDGTSGYPLGGREVGGLLARFAEQLVHAPSIARALETSP
ncbi:hypothetical protein [Halomonas urmiana]|uniref:hypothetical protein n=1 Tax=Halomonas urmiana TaxID=490901 RepID=UPI001305078A|nr:hypothetical protein [Halomonas urmiana]